MKFWDTKTNEKISKSVDELVTIQSAGELCLVVTRSNNGFAQYLMTLYNAIGIAVDFKDLEFEPKYFTISNTTVVVSNDNVVFSWQFKPLATTGISPFDGIDFPYLAMRRKEFLDKAFHIDDILSSDHSEISRAMLARP